MSRYAAPDSGDIIVDEKKVRRMAMAIAMLERRNSKTKEKSPDAMCKEIRKIIEAEVKKCY